MWTHHTDFHVSSERQNFVDQKKQFNLKPIGNFFFIVLNGKKLDRIRPTHIDPTESRSAPIHYKLFICMYSIWNMKSWCGAAPAPPLWFHVKYCGQHFIQSCQTFTSWPTVHKLFYYRMDLIQRTFNLLFILSFSLFEKGYFPLVSICSNHKLTTKS